MSEWLLAYCGEITAGFDFIPRKITHSPWAFARKDATNVKKLPRIENVLQEGRTRTRGETVE